MCSTDKRITIVGEKRLETLVIHLEDSYLNCSVFAQRVLP